MIGKALATIAVLTCLTTAAYADKASDANVELCKRFYAEINKGNLDIIQELVADGFVDHEEFPGMEPGKEGLHKFFQVMRTAFPDLAITPEFFVADGDKVAAYGAMSGTHQGEFMGMAATGKSFHISVVDIVRLKDGKTVEHWGVTDGVAMMEQLGAMSHDDHEGHDHK